MTAVLDRLDIDFLKQGVLKFEQQNGEVLVDEPSDTWNVGCTCCSAACACNCDGSCQGTCLGTAY